MVESIITHCQTQTHDVKEENDSELIKLFDYLIKLFYFLIKLFH